MVIPPESLQPHILDALIEDFVTRDGAIHGHTDITLERMTAEVREQLKKGLAEILYDEENQSWTIVRKGG